MVSFFAMTAGRLSAKARALVLCISGSLLLGSCAISAGGVGGPDGPTLSLGSPVASVIVKLSNRERRTARASALSANPQLMRAAQLHANQMARLGRVGHVLKGAPYPDLPDRIVASGYNWKAVGENIAAGNLTPQEAVQGWMKSPPHRRNLLSGDYSEIGIGYAVDSAGSKYYVQVFGHPPR
jgi:uncharacterized protein YkwD